MPLHSLDSPLFANSQAFLKAYFCYFGFWMYPLFQNTSSTLLCWQNRIFVGMSYFIKISVLSPILSTKRLSTRALMGAQLEYEQAGCDMLVKTCGSVDMKLDSQRRGLGFKSCCCDSCSLAYSLSERTENRSRGGYLTSRNSFFCVQIGTHKQTRTQTDTHTQTWSNTDRDTDTVTDTHTHPHTHTHTHTHKCFELLSKCQLVK